MRGDTNSPSSSSISTNRSTTSWTNSIGTAWGGGSTTGNRTGDRTTGVGAVDPEGPRGATGTYNKSRAWLEGVETPEADTTRMTGVLCRANRSSFTPGRSKAGRKRTTRMW